MNYNLPMEDRAQRVPSWLRQASRVTHQPRVTLNCGREKAPLYKKGTYILLGLWWEEADGQTGPNMPNDKHLLEELQYISLLVFIYEGESNENIKYFLSRNLLNTLWNCSTSWTMWCDDPWLISICAAISFTVMWWFSFMMASTAAMPSGVPTRCSWPGRGESVTELMAFMSFRVHSYTCCSDRHASPYWTFICRWISLLKKRMTMLFFHGACCKLGRHLYTTTAPSCCIPASYCHLSATLQTISITVVNLQDNRAVFRIFIALLRFSFDSPSYNIFSLES